MALTGLKLNIAEKKYVVKQNDNLNGKEKNCNKKYENTV